VGVSHWDFLAIYATSYCSIFALNYEGVSYCITALYKKQAKTMHFAM